MILSKSVKYESIVSMIHQCDKSTWNHHGSVYASNSIFIPGPKLFQIYFPPELLCFQNSCNYMIRDQVYDSDRTQY